MRNFSKIVFLLLFSTAVFAQGVCDKTGVEKGGFAFDGPAAVCIGQEVKMKDNSGGTEVKYIFGYKGEDASKLAGLNPTTDTKWTFLAAGQYVILQYGKKNGKEMYYCNLVTVRESTEPVFSNSACNEYIVIDIPKDPANNFDYYIIEWGDGTTTNIPVGTILPIKQPHNYPANVPTRTIRVEGFYNTPSSCPRASTKIISMNGGSNYPNIKTLEMSADSKSATITLTGALDEYDLYQRSATGNYVNGQPFMRNVRPSTFTVSLVDTVQSCFRVFRNFGCQEGSGEVCTTKLDVKPQDKTNILKWISNPTGGIMKIYEVTVEVKGVTTTIKREEVGGASTIIPLPGNPHSDQIDCTKEYCYQVVNKVSGIIERRFNYESTSLSPKRCINRKEIIPDAITESVVTVKDNNQVEINITDNSPWTLQRKEYLYYKFENNTLDKINFGTLNKQYTDASVDASTKSFCYKVAFIDECESTSATSPALCTVFLDQITGGNLQWTNISPFGNANISKFDVEGFDEQTNISTVEATKNATEIVYTPNLDNFEIEAKYRIKAVSANGKESFSNTYTIPIAVKLFLPDAFTPNGDNLNDNLTINGSTKRIANFEIQIYNRWGNPVFTSTDPSLTWDGTFQNINAPSDTYSFKIVAKLDDGKELTKSGRFLLLR